MRPVNQSPSSALLLTINYLMTVTMNTVCSVRTSLNDSPPAQLSPLRRQSYLWQVHLVTMRTGEVRFSFAGRPYLIYRYAIPESLSSAHGRRPSSNFHVQTQRTPSIQSKRSFTSTVSGLLKRASSKRRTSLAAADWSDAGSVFSSPKTPERSGFSSASSKPSHLSQATDSSRTYHDSDAPFSRKTKPDRTPVTQAFRSDTISRSPARNVRRAPSLPPSSFPGASLNAEAKAAAEMSIIDTLADDEDLQSAKDIREALEKIEAEGRRLLDAFNGLELSTLVRQQRRPGHAPLSAAAAFLPSPVDSESHWKANILSPAASIRGGKDNDAMSTRSGGSARTAFSARHRSPSVSSRTRPLNMGAAPVFQPVSLARKNSLSSISSRHRSGTSPAQPLGRFGLASASSLNLGRSSNHLPLAPVSEGEASMSHHPRPAEEKPPKSTEGSQYSGSIKQARTEDDILALEAEMADIRRRRGEVTARYEARIEYLRAKLKGAELREKLLKR